MTQEQTAVGLEDPVAVDPAPEAYNAFVERASLAGVQVVAVSGERRAPGEAPITQFDLRAGFQVDDGHIHFRFDGVGKLTDEDQNDYGEVTTSVVVSLAVQEVPDTACIQRFGATSATMIAHPYLREVLASTAQRLGFPGVTLPMAVRRAGSDDHHGDPD